MPLFRLPCPPDEAVGGIITVQIHGIKVYAVAVYIALHIKHSAEFLIVTVVAEIMSLYIIKKLLIGLIISLVPLIQLLALYSYQVIHAYAEMAVEIISAVFFTKPGLIPVLAVKEDRHRYAPYPKSIPVFHQQREDGIHLAGP